MSKYQDIATALATRMNTITDLGIVHDQRRWNADLSGYLDLTKATVAGVDQIRFWMITREAAPAEPGDAFGQVQYSHKFVIIGAQGLDDSAGTYATFQGLVEQVCTKLNSARDLGLAYVTDYGCGPASVRSIGEEPIGGTLCHVCEIEFPVVTVDDANYA